VAHDGGGFRQMHQDQPADDRIKLLIQCQVEDIPSQEGNLGEGSFLDTRLCQAQRFKAAVDA